MPDLCVIADVQALTQKTYTGSTTPTSTQVGTWITDASALVEELTGFKYAEQTVTSEKHDGNGTQYIKLNYYPLTSVTSLTVDETALTQNTDYWIKDAKAGVLECYTAPLQRVDGSTTGHQNIIVAYKYGVTIIPASVKNLAAVMAAMRALSAEATASNPGAALKQYSDGDVSITYSEGNAKLEGLLTQYAELRKLVPGKTRMVVGGLE